MNTATASRTRRPKCPGSGRNAYGRTSRDFDPTMPCPVCGERRSVDVHGAMKTHTISQKNLDRYQAGRLVI